MWRGLGYARRLNIFLTDLSAAGCSNYDGQRCAYARPLAIIAQPSDGDSDEGGASSSGGMFTGTRELGPDPETGLAIVLKAGPYGPYVQLGEAGDKGDKPKRASLPKVGLCLEAVPF